MRTIVCGYVTDDTLDSAALFGIEPSVFVTNGLHEPPWTLLDTRVYKLCPKLPPELGIPARNYTLVQNADALILKGRDDHLLNLAYMYGLTVYAEEP